MKWLSMVSIKVSFTLGLPSYWVNWKWMALEKVDGKWNITKKIGYCWVMSFLLSTGIEINLFQPIVVFHIETSHLISTTNQMTGF